MTTMVQNPGEARNVIIAQLRHLGYSVDMVEARQVITPTPTAAYRVTGRLRDLDDGDEYGTFTATVYGDGRFEMTGGAFGRVTQNGVDEFYDL